MIVFDEGLTWILLSSSLCNEFGVVVIKLRIKHIFLTSATFNSLHQLTLYGHIKTAQQRTITQQYGDWYTGRWWVGCYIWYSEEGPGWAAAPPSPLLTVPNVTAHPSTASVPTSYYWMWQYNYLCTLRVKNTSTALAAIFLIVLLSFTYFSICIRQKIHLNLNALKKMFSRNKCSLYRFK